MAAATGSQAITVLSEGFDNVATLPAAGWVQVNNSTAPLGTSWFQGNAGIFAASSGAANSYIAANFLSTGSAAGAVSNWLMTPEVALDATSVLSFLVQTAGDGFLDKIEVRLSTSGASTNVADFSTVLGSFQASTLTGWVGLTLRHERHRHAHHGAHWPSAMWSTTFPPLATIWVWTAWSSRRPFLSRVRTC